MSAFTPEQPSVRGLVDRMSHELSAKAVVLLHENGQVLQRSGWIDDHEYPAMAALVVAMIAAGKSLSHLGQAFLGIPSRFTCDSDKMGLYTVGVTPEIWLTVLYEQPLNPGQFRMKVRRYAELLAKLGVKKPTQWDSADTGPGTSVVVPGGPIAGATVGNGPSNGANLPPAGLQERNAQQEKLTKKDSSLFTNITDEEIDELFENAGPRG